MLSLRHCLACVLFPLLTGCTDPHPYFREAKPVRVTVEGSTFEVRLQGTLAEALRISPEYAPRLGPLRLRAAKAMEIVSGCQVDGVLGDQALMTGVLNCEAAPPLSQGEGPAPLRTACAFTPGYFWSDEARIRGGLLNGSLSTRYGGDLALSHCLWGRWR